ncbi:MAG: class I SAM-dependent DNA methyltransferase, partial [Anaerolineae bacterium]|nr:class I SAM-dependent DNA methyltransferase [Anaerolineae bacterium]
PILEPNGHNIRLMDAILAYDADGNPIEPEWEAAEVVVGNPPFLGGKKMRGELGDRYLTDLRTLYRGRLPKDSDLVTYWFERARSEIERGQLRRAGLLATNSIRDGSNREVLKRIKQSGDIFIAWSDREWMLDGAAVNISIIGFDQGAESDKWLDDHPVTTINANLTKNVDLTTIQPLRENEGLCFLGVLKSGRFDLSSETAKKWLQAPLNPNGRPNSDVIKPRRNGADLTGRPNQTWLIDFAERSEVEAAAYELPFQYVKEQVKPQREQNRVKALREQWWLLGRTRPLLRQKLIGLTRYLATPEVAKHRFFVWLDLDTVPDHTLHVIVRDDDYFSNRRNLRRSSALYIYPYF